jgi:hypothetical protein
VLGIALAAHSLASLGFWLAQPRGFALFTRSFVEHQLIVPAIFAVSLAGLGAMILKRPPVAWLSTGILAGFWIGSASIIVLAGTTIHARIFWLVLPAAAALLSLAWRLARPGVGLLSAGTLAGLTVAGAFWACSWAPPATTRPHGGTLETVPATPGVATIEKEGIRVSVQGNRVAVASGSRVADLWPAFDYFAVSDRGTWSLFEFRSTSIPRWTCGGTEQGGLVLTGENEDFQSSIQVWIGNRAVHLKGQTLVRRELSAHLASVLQLYFHGEGDASVEGIPWNMGNVDAYSQFITLRHGRTEFLQAAWKEKGPFETLGTWALGDPVLSIDGWKFQLLGWAEQGSREASPTAGWGVSQACIERSGRHTYFWGLATTSIGIGWHTVRTAPGVYQLEAVVTPP